MSLFGKNIKKIRGIKGLSQQAFADLFDLKRGTLGAYEEGRSEPKIDTIIKIANYFSISIDHLLIHELTVNSLLKFTDDLSLLSSTTISPTLAEIPYIDSSTESDYIAKHTQSNFIDTLPKLQLPLDTSQHYRGYTVSDLEMTSGTHGFYPDDIMIGEQLSIAEIQDVKNNTLVFIVTPKKIMLRRIHDTPNKSILQADHPSIPDEDLALDTILEIWRVCYVFYKRTPEVSSGLTAKIEAIEHELSKMKAQLK